MTSHALIFFAAVGFTWFLWLITDIIWDLLIGLKAHVLPYLKSTTTDLSTKFGSWAGNLSVFFLFDRVLFCLMIDNDTCLNFRMEI